VSNCNDQPQIDFFLRTLNIWSFIYSLTQ